MKTMRQELNELGFDWNKGSIIIQYHIDELAEDGEPDKVSNIETTYLDTKVYAMVWPKDNIDSFLDIEYRSDDGYSPPWKDWGDLPVFIAEDLERIYFSTCDHETEEMWIDVIEKDIMKYADPDKHRITFY